MNIKNIIIVNDYSFVEGGASNVALRSAIELKKCGYNVTLFSAVGPPMEELKRYGVNCITTEQFDILNNTNRVQAMIQGIWNIKAAKRFSELLKDFDKDSTIIHLHLWCKALSSSIIRVAIKRKYKIVQTLHDYFTVCPNGGLYNYNTQEICKSKPMSKECIFCNCDSRHYYHKIWRIIRQIYQKKKGFMPSGVRDYIYISEMSKQIIREHLPKNSKFYYVRNPIDISKEEKVNVIKNNTFLYVGRLSKEKGVLLLAQAAKELHSRIIFVGDGELKEQIKSIYPEAKITGWLDKNEINKYLNKARALIFPSLWYETLGMTALEAKAKGIPVVVSDKCTARDVIKDNEEGLWFKRGNLQDLKDKMINILDDDLAYTLSNNSYLEYWKEPYDNNNHLRELIKCYNTILND